MRNLIPLNSPLLTGIAGARLLAPLALLAAALCGAQFVAAQAPAPAAPSAAAHRRTHPRKRPAKTPAQSPAPQPAALPAKPPAPEVPLWPANEKPAQATVTWNSEGLRIEAANSSLQQILDDVATATGAKVEGFNADERIFGAYGPGQARDVLYQLLQGSGYNVLMIGDQGQGTPREIVLTARNAAAPAPAANPVQNSDEDVDPDEQPAVRPPIRPNFGPGGPRRTPEQMEQWQREQHQQPGQPPEPEQPQ